MKTMDNERADHLPNVLDIKLSTRGRFTLPKSMKDALGWPAGTVLDVERDGDAVVFHRRTDAGSDQKGVRQGAKSRGSRP